MATTSYGTSAIKRTRFTNAQLHALDDAIFTWLDEQQPATD